MTDPLLQARNISHNYPRRNRVMPALAEVSFSLREDEFVCVVGNSGSGKSTVLRLCRDCKQTALMITHGIQEAVFLADRVLVLSGQPGRIAGRHLR